MAEAADDTTTSCGLAVSAAARGRALRIAREQALLSPQELASRAKELANGGLRLNRDTIYDYEAGRELLEEPVVGYLAQVLAVPSSFLLSPTSSGEPNDLSASPSSEAKQAFVDGVEFATTIFLTRTMRQTYTRIQGVELELGLEVCRKEKLNRFVDELRSIVECTKDHIRFVRSTRHIGDKFSELHERLKATSRDIATVVDELEHANEDSILDAFASSQRELVRIAALLEETVLEYEREVEKFGSYRDCFLTVQSRDEGTMTESTACQLEVVRQTFNALRELETASLEFDIVSRRSPLDWNQLGTLAWRICDLTQLADIEVRKLDLDESSPIKEAIKYMVSYVASAKDVLSRKDTDPCESPGDEDLYRLRTAFSHVQQRVPSLQNCIGLRTSRLDRLWATEPSGLARIRPK